MVPRLFFYLILKGLYQGFQIRHCLFLNSFQKMKREAKGLIENLPLLPKIGYHLWTAPYLFIRAFKWGIVCFWIHFRRSKKEAKCLSENLGVPKLIWASVPILQRGGPLWPSWLESVYHFLSFWTRLTKIHDFVSFDTCQVPIKLFFKKIF